MKTGNLNVRSNLWGNLEWQPLIKDKDLSSPPSPVKGNRYIVAATGSGDWADHTGDIAYYNGSSWEFTTKKEGFICYVEDENMLYSYTGSAWEEISSGGLTEDSIDNFTIQLTNSKLKVADRIELNTFLLAYRLAVANSATKYNLVDGMSDEFEDETGVDTAASTYESYDATYDYYTNEVTAGGIDSYVKFASHFNGPNGAKEIVDDGNTGHVITQAGTASLNTGQKKFGSSSLLLDGDSDYITIPDHDDWDLTGDFTIDCWVRFNNTSGYQTILGRGPTDDSTSYIMLRKNDAHAVDAFIRRADGTIIGRIIAGSLSSTNTWYHIAYIRNGDDFKVFIDGTQAGSTVTSSDAGGSFTYPITIGRASYPPYGYFINGYIDELRISKGIARWTTTFTPPTAAYTSDSYTKLLLHMNTHDESNSHHIPTFTGGAAISTAQKKFGSGSLLLGSGKRISVPDSSDWDFGSGDFTVDLWIYWSGTSNQWAPFCGQYIGGSSNAWCFYREYNTLRFRYSTDGSNDTVLQVNWTPSTATWYHVAVVRNGSNLYFFVDGTQVGSTQTLSATIFNAATILEIGTFYDNNLGYIDGYIDELRISKGIARWTTTFTPPTGEYSSSVTIYDMTLKSNSYTAQSTPTQARLVLFEEDVDSATINTNILGYVSRDGGTTYTQVTLVDEGYYESTKRILSCSPLDISGQPSGTSMKWKVATANTKRIKLHGSGMSWL